MAYELYRHYNTEGVLLYVGISLSAITRLQRHKKDSLWFGAVAHITIERYSTLEAVKEAEAAAIVEEEPVFNKNYNHNGPRSFTTIDVAELEVDDSMQLKMEHSNIVRKLLEALTPKERRVVDLRYGLSGDGEYTLEEIGWMIGGTRQYAYILLVSAENKMRWRAAKRYELMTMPLPKPLPKPPPRKITLEELGL